MTVRWWKNPGDQWNLECDTDPGVVTCIHMYDVMTKARPDEPEALSIPIGKLRLPMAGEFPKFASFENNASTAMTVEKVGVFEVEVSDAINDYGTRKVTLPTTETPQFLMMLNPEDPLVSIYSTAVEFVNSQVAYSAGDKFGNCTGVSHKLTYQAELKFLNNFVELEPMLKLWDLLSKLQTGSCIVCMWRRAEANMNAGASASGLGNL